MKLEDLRKKFPNWEIDPPHHMNANEDCMGGETKPYWRMFANPINCSAARWVIVAAAPEDAGAEGAINDMLVKLITADDKWQQEM